MLFIDYQWDLSEAGMLLDEELNLEHTGWQMGDYFQLRKTKDGRMVLSRMPEIQKFLIDGVQQNVEENN